MVTRGTPGSVRISWGTQSLIGRVTLLWVSRTLVSPSGTSDTTLCGNVTALWIDVLSASTSSTSVPVCGLVSQCKMFGHAVSAAGCDRPVSVTGRRVALHCAPVCHGTPGWKSCPQGPPGCRRGDPSSSRQSQQCCRCHLGRKEGK